MCEPERAARAWEESEESVFSSSGVREEEENVGKDSECYKTSGGSGSEESVVFQVTCQSQDPVLLQTHGWGLAQSVSVCR